MDGLMIDCEDMQSLSFENVLGELLKEGVEPMPGLHELLVDYFDAVVSDQYLKRGKPAPDIFIKASQLIGVQPGHAVVLEDAQEGVKAALVAGMKVVVMPNR